MEDHKVKFIFAGKTNFYEVISKNSGKKYNVSIQLRCECGGPMNPYNNVKIKEKGMCSHIEDVLKEIVQTGNISIIYT